MAFFLTYHSSFLTGGPGNDLIAFGVAVTPLPGMTVTELWNHDTIDGGAGNDTIRASLGEDRITGGPGDDLISGGTGNPFPTGPGGDTFVYNIERQPGAGGSVALFRNGQHPSERANAQAWENYAKQAAKKGYDAEVGQTEGGHTLWGRLTVGEPTFVPLDGHDTITDFRPETGDRVLFQGVGADGEEAFRLHLSFQGGTLFYDTQPLMTFQGVETFDMGWILFG